MKLIKNQLFRIIMFAAIVCGVHAVTVLAQPGAGAASIIEVDQGQTNTGGAVNPLRSNANNALGLLNAPPENPGETDYFSLGFPDADGPGTITLGFACRIVNGTGPDVSIFETTTINPYPTERVRVEALDPNTNTFVFIGIAENGAQPNSTQTDLDLGALAYTTQIRITDISEPVDPSIDFSADGFDLRAVLVINGSCPPFPTGGQFVIGDLVSANPGPGMTPGDTVYYWGAQWTQNNPKTGGVSPGTHSFKGFENGVGMPACGGTWTSRPGNSTPPPATVGSTMAIIVSSNVTKTGPVLSGDIKKILLIQTLPGYQGNPGHEGRGRVLEVLCSVP